MSRTSIARTRASPIGAPNPPVRAISGANASSPWNYRFGRRNMWPPGDPGGIDEAARVGALSLSLGTGWAKSLSFTTGQCPVMRYNHELMKAILHDKVQIARAVNATKISLDEAPQGYANFDKGVAEKYVIDPHGMVA
jgi:glutathione-independent formaldehyde dehydrogenase